MRLMVILNKEKNFNRLKSVIIILIVLVSNFININNLLSQDNIDNIFYFKPAENLSYSEILKINLNNLLQLENSFTYMKYLNAGFYSIDSSNEKIYKINFLNSGGNEYKNKADIKKFIVFKKSEAMVNSVKFKYLELENENLIIDYDKARSIILKKANTSFDNLSPFPMIGYNWKQKILMDTEILNFPAQGFYWGKILNKTFTKSKLLTITGEQCQLYSSLTDGVAFTFNSQYTKVFTVDRMWNRVVWFDQNMTNPYTRTYGEQGSGYAQFSNPSGIAINGPYMFIGNGQEYDYPIYVTDFSNNRIVKFIYNMNYSTNSWGWRIKPNSFTTVKNIDNPYDIALHNGVNNGTDINAQNDDIIWFTTNNSYFKELQSIDKDGNIKNYVTQFQYNGQSYTLNPDKISVYKSPINQNINILACIDNDLHCVIFFKLNPDGTLPSNFPTSTSIWRFNEWDKLTSINLMSANPNLGLDAIVTYNHEGNGCVNFFKIHVINGQPIADYLASSFSGFNSVNQFIKLNDITSQSGYVNFFTMEDWNDNYGVRKYKAGLDVIGNPSLSTYCTETNRMVYKIRFTNPCRASFIAERKPSGGQWTPVTLYISGYGNEYGDIFLPSGTHELVMSMSSFDNLSDEDEIRVFSKFLPTDENFNNYIPSHLIEYQPMTSLIQRCNQIGGCPFVFVNNGSEFIQDNNILHRSEFVDNVNHDIEDKYILRVTPEFDQTDSTCQIKIRELNNDISYFDQFKLVAIDRPLGTNFGISEKNDYVLYFPQITSSPIYAEHEGEDVTSELGFDSSFTKTIVGDEEDYVTANFENSSFRSDNTRMKNILKNSVKKINLNSQNRNSKNKKLKSESDSQIEDSIAILIDPSVTDLIQIGPPAKKPAGTITAVDSKDPEVPIVQEFAKRQNTSPVIITVGKNVNIDSVISFWYSDFMISYFAVSPVYYGGYIENEFDFIEANDSVYGSVLTSLSSLDQVYAVMDSTTNITLKFKNTFGNVQPGYIREYVLITNGRYEKLINGNRPLSSLKENITLGIPDQYMLYQNYPNPFNPVTKIKFDLPNEGLVSIKVYDMLGKVVYSFNENKLAGYHHIRFDGSNLSSGIYFYKIVSGNFVQTKRMVLLK